MLNILELFCGTKSVGKCMEAVGLNVISLDWEKEFNPTHCCDIMDFDYKQYPKDYFSYIWMSPDCRFYSKLQNTWIGRKKKDGIITTREIIEENRKESDKLIYKCWEIVDYFNLCGGYWFLENPLSTLKDREVMKDKPFYIVDYCKYSDWGYRKRTCIWTNKKDFEPLICHNDCENMIVIDTNGAIRRDTGKVIKSSTRLLHNKPIGNGDKLRDIRKNNFRFIMDNGVVIKVNTEELREKYKNYPTFEMGEAKHKKGFGSYVEGQTTITPLNKVSKANTTLKHNKDVSKDFGGGTNRLDRYRIPENLIYSLFFD